MVKRRPLAFHPRNFSERLSSGTGRVGLPGYRNLIWHQHPPSRRQRTPRLLPLIRTRPSWPTFFFDLNPSSHPFILFFGIYPSRFGENGDLVHPPPLTEAQAPREAGLWPCVFCYFRCWMFTGLWVFFFFFFYFFVFFLFSSVCSLTLPVSSGKGTERGRVHKRRGSHADDGTLTVEGSVEMGQETGNGREISPSSTRGRGGE